MQLLVVEVVGMVDVMNEMMDMDNVVRIVMDKRDNRVHVDIVDMNNHMYQDVDVLMVHVLSDWLDLM